ncbi:T3SS effector HopA1 family protein [Streptosporangium sp. NPDC087985]|uniref:T3SS effector HopA1 family protein n=1 Tax=Streptosporangium sp. NPDC087985 TaxID=3366196 RepID=UPI0037F6D3BD
MGTDNVVAVVDDYRLTAELEAVLGAVDIAPDGLGARVGERVVEVDGVRALWPALSTALYETFHSGHAHDPSTRPGTRDPALEAALTAGVPHRHTTTLARVHAGENASDTGWVVDLLDVRVRVPAERVVAVEPDGRAVIRADAIRPALSPGFFLCDGSAGSVLGAGPILRFYVHLADATFTPAAWSAALATLEAWKVPYRAKAFSNPAGYPRRDALVIYLEEAGWPALESLVEVVSALPGLVDDTSSFAKRVGPGLAIAWDPADDRTGMRRLSFGEHRSRVVAEGLIKGTAEGISRATAVIAALRAAGIDPAEPFRNRTSPLLPIGA